MPTLTLTEQDLFVCHICGDPVFLAESRGKYLLLSATPLADVSSDAVAFAFMSDGRFAPRMVPACDAPAGAVLYAYYWKDCRRLPLLLREEGRRWADVPEVRRAG